MLYQLSYLASRRFSVAPMRRITMLLLAAALCVVAGCGGGHDSSTNALDDALGYFPKDAPFVAAVETDPNGDQVKQAMSLLGRFPGSQLLAARLQNLAGIRFVDWSRDVKPQLGAPAVIGLEQPEAGKNIAVATIVALRVKHPLAVKQLLLRQPSVRGTSKSSGARIYEDPIQHRYAAVDGDVLVAGTNRDILEHALALKRTDNRMRAGGFDRDFAGLPSDGLIRVSADPRALIGVDPRLRPALGVKWLNALRRLGLVVKMRSSGVTLDFHLASDKSSLTDGDLPLPVKTGPLPLIGGQDEVRVGIREPGRLAKLLTAVVDVVAPARAAQFKARQPRGIDLQQQLPHHLASVAALAVNPFTRAFALRADLNDAAEVKAALGPLAPALPGLAALLGVRGLGVGTPQPGESFYALATPKGRTVVFGVVGNSLVAASDAKRAAHLPAQRAHTARGGTGAAVMTLDARRLAATLLARRLNGPAAVLAPLAVASLRDLTGALTINRSGLNGHFNLTIVK